MNHQISNLLNESKPVHCWENDAVYLFVFLAFFSTQQANAFASPSPAWASTVLSRLDPAEAEQIRMVIEHSTLQKSVERFRFRSQPAIFDFLLDHPDFAAVAARELRIARYRITPRSDGTYDAVDMQGIHGSFRPLYITHGERVYDGIGSYRPSFFPSFSGHAVVRLRYQHRLDPDGLPVVENRAEVYVRLDSRIAAFFAKLFLPFLQRVVDQKVNQALTVAKRVSEQVAMNPMAVYNRLRQSPVLDRATLESFRQLINGTHQEVRWRETATVC
jgi:hypothetical protein